MRITRAAAAGLLSAAIVNAITPTVAQEHPETSNATTLQQANAPTGRDERVALPESIPDPIEPFNRAMWHFNEGLLQAVIQPTARGYRFIVRFIRGGQPRDLPEPEHLCHLRRDV
jgi:ABC-type transporter lipoprotein component MlaA